MSEGPRKILLAGRGIRGVWGLSPDERIRKQAAKLDIPVVGREEISGPDEEVILINRRFLLETVFLTHLKQAGEGSITVAQGAAPIAIITRGGKVDAALEAIEGRAPPPAPVKTLEDIGTLFQSSLRKDTATLVFDSKTAAERDLAWGLYINSFKGVTDFITKYVWPVPAFWLTRLAHRLGFSPNTVTTISLVLVILATWAFWEGAFGWGLLAAWGMCILDTVDGKLARVTMNYSGWGEAYDHGIDLIHPPFWYYAWGAGLVSAGYAAGLPVWDLWIIIGGYVLGRVLEGLFMLIGKMEMWVWRPMDSFVRLIVARRNPNLLLLTIFTLFGYPGLGLAAVTIWTLVSLAYQLYSIAVLSLTRLAGQIPKPWLGQT